MKILILGGGGREDALAWKLYMEGHKLICAPGNPGMDRWGQCVPLDIKNPQAVSDFVRANRIEFTVVGPELPLSLGIVDHFNEIERRDKIPMPIFGPTKSAAEAETNKNWIVALLGFNGIPVPRTAMFNNFEEVKQAVSKRSPPFVIKKSGLAAGKGAEVVNSEEELGPALSRLFNLGDGHYQIQEKLVGVELSAFYCTDSVDFKFMGSAQDYKPLAKGSPLNTGGMGGVSPHYLWTPELQKTVEEQIVGRTIKALRETFRPYRGIMYFQLMLTEEYGPVVIEINCRFGDPETQILMPRLESDLRPYLTAATQDGVLKTLPEPRFKAGITVGYSLTSEGYPGEAIVNRPIMITTEPAANTLEHYARVFHAGTKRVNGQLRTAGGRVFTVVGSGKDYYEAQNMAKMGLGLIHFEGKFFRYDVGNEAVEFEKSKQEVR